MASRANSLRNMPERATPAPADVPARAPLDGASLDLRPLIQPYRNRGRLTVRIEKLPQSARLSAGQNNGDGTWSLAQDELEGLCYFPPSGFDEHALVLRLIAKDETGASTVALLEIQVPGAGDRQSSDADAAKPSRKGTHAQAADPALHEEIARLKASLAEREAELSRIAAAGEQVDAQLQQRVDATLWAAESIWKHEEAARLETARKEIAEQYESQLEKERRAQAEIRNAGEESTAALRQLQERIAASEAVRAQRDAEIARLQAQLDQVRRERDADVAAAKAAAATEAGALTDREAEIRRLQAQLDQAHRERDADIAALKAAGTAEAAAQAERNERAAKALAEITARCEIAEAAHATSRAQNERHHRETERHFQAELEKLRRETQEVAAAKAAADLAAGEKLKLAQSLWQQQTAKALGELRARCQAAETALASAQAAGPSEKMDAEWIQMQAEIASLRLEREELLAAKTAGDQTAAERQKAAQALWQQQSAKALAEVTARCEIAEAALASAARTGTASSRDPQWVQLQEELERLRRENQQTAAAKAAGELAAAEALKTARAQWQQQSAKSLAEITARCEAAETALAAARANSANLAESDAYIRSLNREIKTLQAALVDREAALGRAQSALQQTQFGTEARAPATQWRPLPGGNRLHDSDDSETEKHNSHLLRDIAILFAVVIITVLAFPYLERMLPNDLRWQIENTLGMANTNAVEPPAPAPAAPPQPAAKPEHLATVTRGVKMRAQPSANSALVANLKRGIAIAILETKGDWDRVTVSGAGQPAQEGWVYKSYVQEIPNAPASASPAPRASATKTGTSAAAKPQETPAETGAGSEPDRAAATAGTGEPERPAGAQASPP